jgi:hypothetical protein
VNENHVEENQEVRLRRRRSREEIKRLVVTYETSGERVRDFLSDSPFGVERFAVALEKAGPGQG